MSKSKASRSRPSSPNFRLTTGGSRREDSRMGTASGRPNGGGLRAGIVGAGFVGAVHATAARRAGARIAGVSASSKVSTSEAVDRLGAERGYAEADALVNSPDIDVVHICTPNYLHFALAEAALAAGKHVICEKPLAVAHADALTLCKRRRGRERGCHRPVRLSLLPDGARGSGADRSTTGSCPPRSRQLSPGLAVNRGGLQLAGRGQGGPAPLARSPTSGRIGAI